MTEVFIEIFISCNTLACEKSVISLFNWTKLQELPQRVKQNWSCNKACSSLHSRGGVIVLDPTDKGMRHISSGKSEVSCVESWQFLLAYCKKWSKDKHTPLPAHTWIHVLAFHPELCASWWKPSKMCRSDLASYLNFRSRSWSGYPRRTWVKT